MKLGFIGCGNMAQAMIGGICDKKAIVPEEMIASGPTPAKMEKVRSIYGIHVTSDNGEVVREADVLILAVKPQMYESVIKEIREYINRDQLIVTIAAGVSMAQTEGYFGKEVKVIRTMPNTPALVGEAMVGMCHNEYVNPPEIDLIKGIFESFGKVEEVTENLIDAVVGVSGSSPAYVYMFIEALADAGVREGLPRNKAYTFAAQAVLGSAKMVLETNEHPGKLKDAVCSPGGTTIEAVKVLEEKGMRNAVIDAVSSATKKSKELGN